MNFQIKEEWYQSIDDMDGADQIFETDQDFWADQVFMVEAITIKSQKELKGTKLSSQLTHN